MTPHDTGGPIEVFFSYSHKDEKLRNKLATHLIMMERQGIITSWHDRKIPPGDEWEPEIDDHLNQAQVILLLVSVDFLASTYCYDIEVKRAMERHEAGEARVIPVILRPSDWKGAPFGKLQALPMDAKPVTHWRSHDDALLDVTEGIRRAVEELAPVRRLRETVPPTTAERRRAPAPLRIWSLPHERNPNFTGREALLEALQSALSSKRSAAVTQAIHGLGGIGKTELAVEYAYRNASQYDLVWWVRSEEPARLAADYADLARELDLREKDAEKQTTVINAVRRWLEEHDGWLLIFDNVPETEDVRDYLPRATTGHVIITSRDPNWGGVASPLSVQLWDREESVDFLLKRTRQDGQEGADALADALGDLPLALEQAAAYIEEKKCSLSDYLIVFKEHQSELLAKPSETQDYPSTVATTWELAFQRLEEEVPAAADLLSLCAFLAPDDIPLDIIREGSKHLPDGLAAAVQDPLAFDEAIAALLRYSLVERSGDALSVHRLVQAVARDRLAEDARRAWAEVAVRIVNSVFPFDSDFPENWPMCGRLLPHALAAAAHAEELEVASGAAGALLNQVGVYMQGRARFAEARIAFERALQIDEVAYGSAHRRVAIRVNNLGSVLNEQGDLAGARAHFERALAINEAAYDPDHPEVAKIVNNLGRVLREEGDLEGARAHYERALAINEVAHGPDHPTVAICVNNLGGVLRAEGDLAGAHAHYERALAIDEAAYGPGHLNVANRLNNLGSVLQDQGDLAGARAHYERALRILTELLGDDHPNIVNVRKNLETLGK